MDPNSYTVPTITLLPILFGVIFRYIFFLIEKPKDFRNRVDILENSLTENLALKLTAVLSHLRGIVDTADVIRGDGRETADLVGDYASELNRIFRITIRLGVLNTLFRIGHWTLLVTTTVGILLFLTSFITTAFNSLLFIVAIITVLLQILTVIVLFYQGNKLEDYERL